MQNYNKYFLPANKLQEKFINLLHFVIIEYLYLVTQMVSGTPWKSYKIKSQREKRK